MKSLETMKRETENFEAGLDRLIMFAFGFMRPVDIATKQGVAINKVTNSIDRTQRVLRMYMYNIMTRAEHEAIADILGLPKIVNLRSSLYGELALHKLRTNNITYPKAIEFLADSYRTYRINMALEIHEEQYTIKKFNLRSKTLVDECLSDLLKFQYVDTKAVLQSLAQ